jgi:hypothetical protein
MQGVQDGGTWGEIPPGHGPGGTGAPDPGVGHHGDAGETGFDGTVQDDWSDHDWAAMEAAAASAAFEAFREPPPATVTEALRPAAHHLQPSGGVKERLRDDPWHALREMLTTKATLAAVGGAIAAVVFVVSAVAAFSGDDSDDVALTADPSRGDKERDLEASGGDKADGSSTTASTGATSTASSTTASTEPTTTTEPDDEDEGDDGDEDDQGGGDGGGNGPPATPPSTDPGPPMTSATTVAPTTTTTRANVTNPGIDRFDVVLDSWCNRQTGTVEASFRWTSRNGTAAVLVAPNGQSYDVGTTEDDYDLCPRPGEVWTLRVTGAAGSTPATRTLTVPALDVVG